MAGSDAELWAGLISEIQHAREALSGRLEARGVAFEEDSRPPWLRRLRAAARRAATYWQRPEGSEASEVAAELRACQAGLVAAVCGLRRKQRTRGALAAVSGCGCESSTGSWQRPEGL